MTGYNDLAWTTLNAIKRHLYRRLATPLNQALGRLAIARHVTDPAEMRLQVARAEQGLEVALNLLKAWAVLIHVKSGGIIRPDQRRAIMPDGLPEWLVGHLNTLTAVQIGHTRPIFVQPEAFYESLLLISLVGGRIGQLKKLVIADALHDAQLVLIRAIFEPPSSGPYDSLGVLFKHTATLADPDTRFQLQVLQELLQVNGSALRLQNNQLTGEQSLAAQLHVSAFGGKMEASARAGAAQESGPPRTPDVAPKVPAPGLVATAATATGGDEVENEVDTWIVPPPGWREELAEAGADTKREAEAVIVPPPGFHERLAALLSTGSTSENVSERVSDFRSRLAGLTGDSPGTAETDLRPERRDPNNALSAG